MTESKATIDWSKYEDIFKAADQDRRVGDHDFVVDSVSPMTWDDGRVSIKVAGRLTTAGNAKTDFLLPDHLITDEEKAEAKASGNLRRVTFPLRLLKGLNVHYGKSFDTIEAGDEIRVNTYKDKKEFIRVQEINAPGFVTPVKGGKPATVKAVINRDAPPF